MFLYNNPQHNTAADIVRYRKSTKSHVSMSLKVLEEKGLIERRIDKDNKKRVEIYLLDSADDIIKEGIDGIEVFSTYHSPEQIDYFYNRAEKNNLLMTFGSDFHGKNKPHIRLKGYPVPEKYEGMKEKLVEDFMGKLK